MAAVNLLVDKRRDFAYFDFQDNDAEYSYSGRPASGLPLAHCEDGLAISFCSDGEWDVSSWHSQRLGPLTQMLRHVR